MAILLLVAVEPWSTGQRKTEMQETINHVSLLFTHMVEHNAWIHGSSGDTPHVSRKSIKVFNKFSRLTADRHPEWAL